jgi:hypothetical protein
MAKTRGAAGTAMTEAPREGDAIPRQGDPMEEQVVEPAAQPVIPEGNQAMHAAAHGDRPGVNDASGATDDAIAARAYELYLARGGTHGADMDDWLQAEHELRADGGRADGLSYERDHPDDRPID